MANSKMARQLQSKANNPTYRFTNTTDAFSTGEMLAPFIAFGDREAVTVDKERVEYFFSKSGLSQKFRMYLLTVNFQRMSGCLPVWDGQRLLPST